MADERIEVEWIATANKMVQVLDNLNTKFDKLEKTAQKNATSSAKGADHAANSFNKLEQELKDNEAALRGLAIGSREFDLQKQKVDQLRGSVERAKRAIESTGPASTASIGRMGASIGVATGAAIALAAALTRVADAQKEIVSGAAESIVNLDTMARKMQIQAGLTDEGRRAATVAVVQQSSEAGVTAETGFQAATQLAGSGFENAIESGTLKTILDTIQASSFQGSADQLVSAFAETLNAYELDKTNENLRQVAVAAQSLFKQTDFQLTELQDFAKSASVYQAANIKFEEAVAGFTALREVLPAAESGTGLRNFVNKLQQGDLTKENKDNLKRLGLKSEDVDFVGESLVDVINNIKTATDKIPEADRNAAMGKMFGTENVASAKLLLKSADRIQELQKSQQNEAVFQKDRDTAASGMQAQRNRQANLELIQQMPISEQLMQVDQKIRERDAIIKNLQEQGVAAGGVGNLAAVPGVAGGLRAVDFVSSLRSESPVMSQAMESAQYVNPAAFLSNRILNIWDDFKAEQIKTREAIEQLGRQPQQQNVKVVVPQQRPKEAPLPAQTVP